MANEKLIITIFAKDRPGIVEKISDTVLAYQGNWLESSLSRLCGQFTGIVHIGVKDRSQAEEILLALQKLGSDGIKIRAQSDDGVERDSGEIESVQLIVEANDRPGIIREITTALAAANVNVEHMDTECLSASMAGYPIFRAHLFLALPEGFDEEQLERVLENVSDDLMVSVAEED